MMKYIYPLRNTSKHLSQVRTEQNIDLSKVNSLHRHNLSSEFVDLPSTTLGINPFVNQVLPSQKEFCVPEQVSLAVGSRSFDRNNCLNVLPILLLVSGEGYEETFQIIRRSVEYECAVCLFFFTTLSSKSLFRYILRLLRCMFRKHLNVPKWVNLLYALDVFTTMV